MFQTIADHSIAKLRDGTVVTVLEALHADGLEQAYLVEVDQTADGMMKTVKHSEITEVLWSPA